MSEKTHLKRNVVSIRITDDEKKLLDLLANQQGINVPEYVRRALLTIAQMSSDNQDFLDSIGSKNKEFVVQELKSMIADSKDVLANSIKGSHEGLLERIEKLEKLLDCFLYAYLYHTPEVPEKNKISAKESALIRKKKVLSLIDRCD